MARPIEVREHGKHGPDIVVLHGGPGGQGSVVSLAAALAPSYHVLEPLMRPAGTLPMTMDQHAEDIAQIAPPQATYIGWSWGAMLGLTFASLYPDRVKSLVLVGCGAYDEASREEHLARRRASLGADGEARYFDLLARMRTTTDVEWANSLLGQVTELVEKSQAVEPIGLTATDTVPDAAGYLETWADVIRLQRDHIEPARFSAIGCPVLMLHGEEDTHPGHLIRDVLQIHVTQLAYIGIPACGHVPWYERYGREAFFTALKQWIEGIK
ncbi:MAG: alpha/beta fold hydrolase [Coriobacteriia bacterium]